MCSAMPLALTDLQRRRASSGLLHLCSHLAHHQCLHRRKLMQVGTKKLRSSSTRNYNNILMTYIPIVICIALVHACPVAVSGHLWFRTREPKVGRENRAKHRRPSPILGIATHKCQTPPPSLPYTWNCHPQDRAPFFQNGAKSGFEMCFGPSTLGAGAKTRLESRIKEITPHCVCNHKCQTPPSSLPYQGTLQSAPMPPVLVGSQYSCQPTVKLHIFTLVWIFLWERVSMGARGSSWNLPSLYVGLQPTSASMRLERLASTSRGYASFLDALTFPALFAARCCVARSERAGKVCWAVD